MTFLRTRAIGIVLTFFCVASAAKEDPVDLLQRHRYEEAIAAWDRDLKDSRTGEKALRALKGQALAYDKLGSLYEAFERFSLSIMADYYAALAETGNSPLTSLYQGQIQFEMGETVKAKQQFERAKKMGAASVPIVDLANVYLAAIAAKNNEASINLVPKDPDAQWQLWDLKGSNSAVTGNLTANSQRARRCRLSLLLRDAPASIQAIQKALEAVLADSQEPEKLQDGGKNSQINFYDPSMLSTLSKAYYTLAKLSNLEIQQQEGKYPALAEKFNTSIALAQAYLHLGQFEEATKALGDDKSVEAQLVKANLLAKQGKKKEGQSILDNLAQQAGRNGALKRDIAEVIYWAGLDPDKGLQLIQQALRDKNGPNYYRVQAGLLIAKGRGEDALQQYSKGYKIEFRNRIDHIDPEYMSDYSSALYRTNKLRYEEIVETLYHLQKEFPPTRQMHYCMQGVSAGLARSFEAQRILRKGG